MAHPPETDFDNSLPDVMEPSVLHERDFNRFAPALDLSIRDWSSVFDAHAAPPSLQRNLFRTNVQNQLCALAVGVCAINPCPETRELSMKIRELPDELKLTILEAIERFWTRQSDTSSLEAKLLHLGLRPCESAHARIAALAHRQRLFPDDAE